MDPLAALLGLPSALNSTLQLIDRLLGAAKVDPAQHQTILKSMTAMKERLLDFSHFNDDVDIWKIVHTTTQHLLLSDLKTTLLVLDLNSDSAAAFIQNQVHVLRHEISALDAYRGHIARIRLLPDAQTTLPILVRSKLQLPDGSSWNTWLIEGYEAFSKAFQSGQNADFIQHLRLFKKSCENLNLIADAEIEHRISLLLQSLNQFRANLSEIQ